MLLLLMEGLLAVSRADRGSDNADGQGDGGDHALDDASHVGASVIGEIGWHGQVAVLRQTMSRMTIGFGIRPSL